MTCNCVDFKPIWQTNKSKNEIQNNKLKSIFNFYETNEVDCELEDFDQNNYHNPSENSSDKPTKVQLLNFNLYKSFEESTYEYLLNF